MGIMSNEEEIYANILAVPDAFFIALLNEKRVLRTSEHFFRITGIESEAAIGVPYDSLGFWDRASERQEIADALEKTGEIHGQEAWLRHRAGRIKPYRVSARTIRLNGSACAVFTATDHSEYKRIEDELEQSEKMHEEVQRIANLGHWELDIATDSIAWSAEIFRIFEMDPREIRPSYDLFLNNVHPEDRAMVNQVFRNSVRDKTIYDVEHRLLIKDKRIKYVRERGCTLYGDNGQPVTSLGTVQDITALRVAEIEKQEVIRCLRQSQKLESIGTLVSGISHDFNNILSAIMGYTELSLDKVGTDTSLERYLSRIHEAGMRAKDLVGQILTFCRQANEEKRPCQLSMLVDEAVNLAKGSASQNIRIKKVVDTEAFILANASQLHRVLMNLFANAMQAMGERGGCLSVDLSLVDTDMDRVRIGRFIDMKPGRYAKLVVSDTGCGMNQETIDRIFEPFFTTKKKKKGTGLGLSVVHGIIKSHDGHVMVYSEEGVGTRISMFFPVISEDVHVSTPTQPLPVGNENILLIDDEVAYVDMMAGLLVSLGYHVSGFTDFKEALAYFSADPNRVDVLISDMNMPGISGDEIVGEFLKMKRELPIIICSGYIDSELEEKMLKKGSCAFLVKPVLKSDIALAIRNALEEKSV